MESHITRFSPRTPQYRDPVLKIITHDRITNDRISPTQKSVPAVRCFEILLGDSAGRYSTMDITIVEEDENPMLHRTDVRFELTHEEATPERLSVRDSLAAMLNKDSKEVVVHDLDTKFGMRKTVGYAKVYESPEHAQDVEQDYMLERNKITAEEDAEGEAEEA